MSAKPVPPKHLLSTFQIRVSVPSSLLFSLLNGLYKDLFTTVLEAASVDDGFNPASFLASLTTSHWIAGRGV